jgi:hypothetical protein
MATGALPFSGSSIALIFDGILHGEATAATKLNPSIALALENIFSKARKKIVSCVTRPPLNCVRT